MKDTMKMPKIWEIMSKFKHFCNSHGWKTSDGNDWVEMNEDYHNFLLTGEIHPSSFRKIASDRKCVVREGVCYRVVNAAYTAWLFSKRIPESVLKLMEENPDYYKRIALYDLSQVAKGKNCCVKINSTDSQVFHEFESFLQDKLKLNIEPFPPFSNEQTSPNNYTTVIA